MVYYKSAGHRVRYEQVAARGRDKVAAEIGRYLSILSVLSADLALEKEKVVERDKVAAEIGRYLLKLELRTEGKCECGYNSSEHGNQCPGCSLPWYTKPG